MPREACNMISRWIDWCAQNRFLVFMGTVLLVLTGIWALRHIPLDALPDISDVEVIIHTPWAGQPPSLIEDQVTYPIVTTLLAAPHVKAVRAQTMFGDSYVFVVFEDTTDLYWARSRVLEYLQQIAGRLPAGVHPVIGPERSRRRHCRHALRLERAECDLRRQEEARRNLRIAAAGSGSRLWLRSFRADPSLDRHP